MPTNQLKAYQLRFPTKWHSEDTQLEQLVHQAGYASTRSMINECGLWCATVKEVKAFLAQQLASKAACA